MGKNINLFKNLLYLIFHNLTGNVDAAVERLINMIGWYKKFDFKIYLKNLYNITFIFTFIILLIIYSKKLINI